jgi:hypothetical protein
VFGAIVMSDIDHIVYALADNWIKPGAMLEMEYVRRHIRHYVGGSAKLLERFSPRDLSISFISDSSTGRAPLFFNSLKRLPRAHCEPSAFCAARMLSAI